jgi:hypothetical protein
MVFLYPQNNHDQGFGIRIHHNAYHNSVFDDDPLYTAHPTQFQSQTNVRVYEKYKIYVAKRVQTGL